MKLDFLLTIIFIFSHYRTCMPKITLPHFAPFVGGFYYQFTTSMALVVIELSCPSGLTTL
ncbi:hypothetical protein I7I48_02092 [Histoplasma ohiense]|nr:hypothetical protein I7I48_02092 [Histoplasma ohiense (nom. inval.)]